MTNDIVQSSRLKEQLKIFEGLFPVIYRKIKIYGPFDKRSIKIETTDRHNYIFTYNGENDWGLQTYKNYIESRRSEQKPSPREQNKPSNDTQK